MRRIGVLAIGGLVGVVCVACGSQQAATTSTVVTTAASTTSVPATTSPDSTLPVTTEPSPSARWIEVAIGSVSSKAFPPCCGANWTGNTSPPLPAPDASLPDGEYAVTMSWPADPSQPLQLELHRFERCSLLPSGSCEEVPAASDLGVDTSATYPLEVRLDSNVQVILVGWQGETFQLAAGDGSALAELASAVDRAYAAQLASRFDGGEDPDAIVADLIAHPRGGFGPPRSGVVTELQFAFGDAPPLLFQAAFPYVDGQRVAGRGTDVLVIPSIGVTDGAVTLHVYAAYYP